MILVASTKSDAMACRVVHSLERRRCDVVTIFVDTIASGLDNFSLVIKGDDATLSLNNKMIRLCDINSAWEWHASLRQWNSSGSVSIAREIQQTFAGMYRLIDRCDWINHPDVTKSTQEKVSQVLFARRMGFIVPDTVIANHWECINLLPRETILKMPMAGIIEGKQPTALPTTILSYEQKRNLRHLSPFPGMHQPFISKKREWRITIVGDKVFPVAIYTDDTARDDWRKHQHDKDRVVFKSEPLPDKTIEGKCKKLLKKMGLRYGAFDFIETPKGEMIFLEVNSAGQYGWLEDELGLPISEAIADLLIEIADKNKTKV